MIVCEKISKVYPQGNGETRAIRNISLTIEAGEFVAITGRSGSGKSTLMNILGALDQPTAGRYLLSGKDLSQASDTELAKVRSHYIGFVFQSFNLLPRLSVWRNVELPLIYSAVTTPERERRVNSALTQVGIRAPSWDSLPNQLSGGEMQRVAIARALVTNPLVILADEPTGNLDWQTSLKILSIFQTLNEEGRTIILVTHDPSVAKRAGRELHLNDGTII